jgi:pimeloyl-ACP methyl ester carboxylesterase
MTLHRRGLLAGLAGASMLGVLPGCTRDQLEDVLDTCPTSTADSVSWVPDAGHPVFWGFQDVGTAQGAPRDIRIYYPSTGGSPQDAPILKQCVGRWPVVLFLHGQNPKGTTLAGYHRKFQLIGADLARSGYVVVAPNHDAVEPVPDNAPALVAAVMADLAWVRQQWNDHKWVDQQLASTAVVGHSFGALLGARVAAAHPEIGAYVSLSGGFNPLPDALPALQAITAPSLFMWGQGGDAILLSFEELDGAGKLWDKLTQPKYAAPFQGEHFDYLRDADAGSAQRGPCAALIGGAAADLATLFISAHLPVPLTHTQIPIGLTKPQVQLTQEQEFFAGAHLSSIEQITTHAGCRIDLRWNVDGVTGSRRLGP